MTVTLAPAHTMTRIPALPLLEVAATVPASQQPFDMVGHISDRLIVNYRIAPEALPLFSIAPLLWDNYEGAAFLSVCLLRYTQLRPHFWPAPLAHRGSCDVLFRLAVQAPSAQGTVRGFLSLLNLNSSRLLSFAGRRFAPHKFAYAPVRLHSNAAQISVTAPGTSLQVQTREVSDTPPLTSIFSSLHDAETFLLDLGGNLSLSRRGSVYLQPILHNSWRASFLQPTEAHFSLLEPWVSSGFLRFDSLLYMRDLRQVWERTHPLSVALPEKSYE